MYCSEIHETKMKRIVFLSLILIVFNTLTHLTVKAQLLSKNFEFNTDFAFYTKYVSRGFTYDNDPVLQAGIYLHYRGLGLSVWNNMDIRNKKDYNSDEVDYLIDYTYSIKNLSLSAGLAYFDCPAVQLFTKEYSLEAGFKYPLSPKISWKHDFGDENQGGGDGDYLVLSLAHSFPLNKLISVDLHGHFGYNSRYYIEGTGRDLALTMGLNLPLTDKLILSPNITYSVPYGDLADKSDGDQESRLYVGVIANY